MGLWGPWMLRQRLPHPQYLLCPGAPVISFLPKVGSPGYGLSPQLVDIEQLDPRGRTPLHLATTLGHLECARVLLAHGADVGRENRSGWTVLQEAVSTRDLELVQLVLRYRDYQRVVKRLAGIPVLLEKLRKAQDFYVEMKWEFTSWVPLVSKICPSDTYKVWKSGQNLRVDTTLLGFDHMTWQRGNRSFVFRGQDTSAVVMEIDHDRRVVYTETLALAGQDRELLLAAAQPTEEQVLSRLTAPVVTTQLDTKNISFERNKTGILGWRSEKTEMVNGYEAKVYGASNVELITRTRTEHLSEQHKGKVKGCKTPLQSFLGIAEQHGGPQNGTLITQTLSQANPTAITAEEYFNPNFELGNRDMGRPMELTTKTQKFKAKLWLCEEHPLSLCEQVAPIIDLMAVSNALFAKLRDFITLRLPPGFPVKIEIPIFHILNARITFGNLNGCDEPVPSVRGSPSSETPSPGSDSSSVSSSSSTTSCRGCEISPALFEAPRGYSVLGGQREAATRDDDDDLLQFAIQQSLLEAGSEYDQVTIWEALTNSKPGTHPMSCEGRRQDRCAPEPATYLTRPQEHPAHAAAPARAPSRPGDGPQPAAQPRLRPRRPRVPELRRAAAAGHGAVGAGAGGAAAARAPGGGGAGAHPAALADGAVAPIAGPLGHATRARPGSQIRPGPRARRAAAGDWSGRLGDLAASQAPEGEGFGTAAGYLSGPGPWRQLARPGPPALLYPDPHSSSLGSDLSKGGARRS
ncbi:ankyrin repeat domain-containing protein 13B isoform X3 [Equus quagga]|uniref:ankyrin repeat domain-containing protein 13B isoform X3 n=1 Tax=Equus quagga TaxID=89248 RepID=UPI001EE25A31|nr:ankyrin repeat domain-containing protein 13B isoform X3 [Equus quagga]